MAIRHLALGPLFLALLLVPAAATTVEAPDVGTLLSQSDYVVRAVVKSATPEWREHAGRRYIGTRVELEIKEVIKGTPPSPLVINLIGGRIGPDELIVEGMPGFRAGDDRVQPDGCSHEKANRLDSRQHVSAIGKEGCPME